MNRNSWNICAWKYVEKYLPFDIVNLVFQYTIPKLWVFVWTPILVDYTSGSAVAIATCKEEAILYLKRECESFDIEEERCKLEYIRGNHICTFGTARTDWENFKAELDRVEPRRLELEDFAIFTGGGS